MINYTFTYADLEYYLLIVVRVTSFIFVVPFLGMRGIPNMVKVGFGLLFSMLLYSVVPRADVTYGTVSGYAMIVMKEAVTGLLIGLAAQMCNLITAFAGQIVDMQTGLSMMTMMDPTTNQNVTITGSLYQYVLLVMLIISGMYRYIVSAIADSFALIPVSGAIFHMNFLLDSMLRFVRNYIVIGFRIALPVFIVTFTVNIILGVLAKVAPQLNMFSVGIQIKILVGVGVMFITCSMLGGATDFVFTQMRVLMREFVRGMS